MTQPDPLSVLIVGSNSGTGGIQRYIDQQAENLPDGIRTTVYDTEVNNTGGMVGFLRGFFETAIDALRFPFQKKPDIVHVHTAHWFSFYRASFYVLFSAYLWRVPVVLHVHGSLFDEFLAADSRVVKALQSAVFHTCDEVIALSEYWREMILRETPAKNVSALPNGIEIDLYSSEPGADPPSVVYISHLSDRKGAREFVAAADELAKRDQNVEIHIGGDGEHADLVKELAATHENVTYHGYVSEGKKRRLLEEGSIFVLPSYAEGLPIAIVEAMAAGNAIVSTTVGSIPEVIDSKSGILVPPKDESALHESICELVESPEDVEEMGYASTKQVEKKYNWNYLSDKISATYDRLE